MKMSTYFYTKPHSILPYIFKPFHISVKALNKKEIKVNSNVSVPLIPWRYAVSRLELLLNIINKYGISFKKSNNNENDNGLIFDVKKKKNFFLYILNIYNIFILILFLLF